jgi:hypothetical protein
MLRLFVASILLCLTPIEANAQDLYLGLTHLNKFHLTVFLPNADKCGITKQLIEDAFMYPASGAKFQVADDPNSGEINIEIETVQLGPGICASSVSLHVLYRQPVTLEYSNTMARAAVLLWNRAGVVTSIDSEHASQIKQGVEDVTKSFITQWNLSNK